MLAHIVIDTPLGKTKLVATDSALVAILLPGQHKPLDSREAQGHPLLLRAARELREYFAGKRRDFTVPIAPQGTPFQQRVWSELARIPYGQHRSYGDLATSLGKPAAARAVGRANALNPLAIVLPCHRVIGKDGSLTGFAGGIDKKRWLLAHEARNPRGLFVGPARSPARSGSSAPKRP